MNKHKKMELKLITPHILFAKWIIKENKIKEFISKFGYWSWEKSKPALKIIINDHGIIGEQSLFYLDLDEGDNECVFFAPYYSKTYITEYGRCLGENIFIPFLCSNSIKILQENDYTIYRLSDNFIVN